MATICLILGVGPMLILLAHELPTVLSRPLSTNIIFVPIFDFFEKWEFSFRDQLAQTGKKTTPDPLLAYVAIDDQSINLQSADLFSPQEIAASKPLQLMSKGWPWPRETYALILDRLFTAGAKVVAIDMLFLSPSDNPKDDAHFRAALDRYADRVMIGANMVLDEEIHDSGRRTFSFPTDTLIPQVSPLDPRIALVNFPNGVNSTVRSTFFRTYVGSDEEQVIPSLAAATLQKSGMVQHLPRDFEPHTIRFAGPWGTYPYIPAWKLFYEEHWKQSLKNGEYFKGKIVILGPAGNWSHDQHQTPLGIIPGPEIHLNAIQAALQGEFLSDCSSLLQLVIILAAMLLPLGIAWGIDQPLIKVVFALGTLAFYFGLSLFSYNYLNLYLPLFSPAFIFIIGSASCISYDFILERIEKGRVRSMFERYMSKNVVGQMLDDFDEFHQSLGGARKKTTILFSDLRGFTTLTEKADSHALVVQLNEYLTEMVACVFSEKGTLDKFIGDAVMAVWGNAITRTPEEDAISAVRTALKMHASLARLNERWAKEGRLALAMGIGVNQGEVIVGNMGSPEKMEFTVIGDAVNLASRLEGLTKEYHSSTLIGENVEQLVRGHFHLRTVALVTVKGKTKPVATFSVLGESKDPLPEAQREFLRLYEEGILQYRSRRFTEAVATFSHCLRLEKDDFLSAEYLKESLHLLANPPDDSWTGVAVMTKK